MRLSDIVICADGGANNLYQTDIVPDMIVGDLDSLDYDTLMYFRELEVLFYKFPSEKDKTDTELATEFAIKKGVKEIILLGVTGTRLDHTLANILLLYKLLQENIKAKIIDGSNEIFIVDKVITIEKEENTFVSFIPLFEKVKGVTMSGFKYLTQNIDFDRGSTMGISNQVKDKAGHIDIKDGIALVIKSRDV